MINAVFPMQLWNDYGIVSYNMGSHATYLAGSYYNILLACEKRHPKLIVVDAYAIHTENKVADTSYIHKMLDTYPISLKKYEAIKELLGEKKLLANEIEFLFNFSMYHTRWNELTKNDFEMKEDYEKGANSRISVDIPSKMGDINTNKVYDGEKTINMEYLTKIIDYCRKENIELLVTYLPYPASEEEIAVSKYVKDICDNERVKYINLLTENIVNYDTDCYDKNSHLNPSGARKVTNYLGKYIIENYNIKDQRNNIKYEFWNNDYNEYIDFKITKLKNNERNLNNYLMLLYGEKDIEYEIVISSKKDIKQGSVFQKLLENLDNSYKTNDNVFAEKQNKTIKITTWDKRDDKEISTVWF